MMNLNNRVTRILTVMMMAAFTLHAPHLLAQAPQIQWAKCYGGSADDQAKDVHRTSDSGYVVCGITASTDGDIQSNHGGKDGWILKLDVLGNIQWQKTFGGTADDGLNAIHQLPDGGYVAAGYTASTDGDIQSNHGANDFWMIRIDSTGNLLWSQTFGGSNDEVANDFASTGDTGFVAVGYTFSDDGQVSSYKDNGDGWIVYLDNNGSFIKQKDKGGSGYDEFKSVITTANGGFLLVGLSASNDGTLAGLNHGGTDAWLARLSRFGTDQWNGLYGDTLDDGGFDVHENISYQFVASGYRNTLGQTDSWLFTVDSLGNFVSEDIHGGTADELPGSSIEKADSNYIVAGSSASDPSGDKDCHYALDDVWMYNTLNGGPITWQKCLGGTGEDISSRAISSPDGSLAICGYTSSTDLDVSGNHGGFDFWVVRLIDGCDVEADFTYSSVVDSFAFTNNSFDGLSFLWSFGDSTTSTDINPTHVYGAEGTYTVCLIATSLCTSDTFCTQVVVTCNPAEAAFTDSSTDLTATFTSTSVNTTSWFWTFGDGATSTLANPVHDYAAVGTYQVCLIASNICSSDTFCQNIDITCAPIIASYTDSASGLTVSFESTTPNATQWKWNFGDGNTSNQENPTHTFADTGSYYVCLVVFNACSSDTLCGYVHTGCLAPVAAYSDSVNGFSVTFTDLTGDATAWSWDFGDGSTDSIQNPSHSYVTGGTYTVCLIASNDCGTDTICMNVVVECPAISSAFDYTVNGLSAGFTDLSMGATTWWWNFGDGSTDSVQNPSHTYADTGTYEVCLIISNGCASDTTCTSVEVQCPPFNASFTYTQNGNEFDFADQSANAVSWSWTFGDGGTSALQNPSYTYSANGIYLVCLNASDSCSSSITCDSVTVIGVGITNNTMINSVSILPNPFNQNATLSFSLGYNEQVAITLTDVQGRILSVIAKGSMTQGNHSILIPRAQLASGVYLLQMKTGSENIVRKLVIE